VCGGGRWSVKDVLAHVSEWHAMALEWYRIGLTGERAPIPAVRDIPPINQRIY